MHVVEDADLASEYLALFDLLFEGGNARQTKRYINEHDPVTDEPMQVVFSPRSKLTDLEEVCSHIQAAKRDIVFCTTFRLHDMITAALWPQRGDDVIRYGLQNQRSKITGTPCLWPMPTSKMGWRVF